MPPSSAFLEEAFRRKPLAHPGLLRDARSLAPGGLAAERKGPAGLGRAWTWLTVTHTQRWHAHRHTTGTGHFSPGRFKSFPVKSDERLYAVLRYVEFTTRCVPIWYNGLQIGAGQAPWRRHRGDEEARKLLSPWPMTRPTDWLRRANRAERRGELEALLGRWGRAEASRMAASLGAYGSLRRLGLGFDLPSPRKTS